MKTTLANLHARLNRAALSFAFLALLSASASATTWIVDAANGPGAQFTSINAALAVAAPGDVIVVRQGSYFEFVTVSIGVTIVGWNATNYPMAVPVNPFQDAVWGGVLVQGVPAGQRAVVSGLVVARPTPVGGVSVGVNACAGVVVLDRVFCPNGGVYVGDSQDVVIQDLRVRHLPGSLPALPGLFVTNSQVQANDVDATATDLGGDPSFQPSAPNACEVVAGSIVCLARPKLIGASGGGPWETSATTPGGGAALRCDGSIVSVISNGSGLYYLVGGEGGERGANSAPGIASGYGAPALIVENGGLVHLKGTPVPFPGAPGSNLAGGPLGTAFPGTLTFTGGSVQSNPQAPATLRFLGATTPGAASFLQYQSGGPFYPFVLFFMPNYDLSVMAPSVQFLCADPFSALFLFTGTANSARLFNLGLNFPASFAGLSGASLIVQGADYISGDYFLTNAINVTLP